MQELFSFYQRFFNSPKNFATSSPKNHLIKRPISPLNTKFFTKKFPLTPKTTPPSLPLNTN